MWLLWKHTSYNIHLPHAKWETGPSSHSTFWGPGIWVEKRCPSCPALSSPNVNTLPSCWNRSEFSLVQLWNFHIIIFFIRSNKKRRKPEDCWEKMIQSSHTQVKPTKYHIYSGHVTNPVWAVGMVWTWDHILKARTSAAWGKGLSSLSGRDRFITFL